MKGLSIWVAFVFVTLFAVSAFSYEIEIMHFPYKGIVYEGLNIPISNESSIQVTKDEYYWFNFTYNGIEYKCHLLVFGAIYVDASKGLDKLLCFDVASFRLRTMGGTGY